MSTLNEIKAEKDISKERLFRLTEHICSLCKRHWSAQGYILCNHCLHGGCQPVPEERKEEILRLEILHNV